MEKIESLIEKVLAYNPKANIDIIKKAYIFSREAHCSQKRVEGSPYIQHPILGRGHTCRHEARFGNYRGRLSP